MRLSVYAIVQRALLLLPLPRPAWLKGALGITRKRVLRLLAGALKAPKGHGCGALCCWSPHAAAMCPLAEPGLLGAAATNRTGKPDPVGKLVDKSNRRKNGTKIAHMLSEIHPIATIKRGTKLPDAATAFRRFGGSHQRVRRNGTHGKSARHPLAAGSKGGGGTPLLACLLSTSDAPY